MISIQYTTSKGEKIRTTLPLINQHYRLEDVLVNCHCSEDRWQIQLTATAPVVLKKIAIIQNIAIDKNDRILCNGFQSWSQTREFMPQERMAPMSLLLNKFASAMGDYDLYRYPFKVGVLHSWTYTYCKKNNDTYHFWASLSEQSGYTLFVFDTPQQSLTIRKECKNRLLQKSETWTALDIYTTKGTEASVFEEYKQQLLPTKRHITNTTPIAGWTSWYHYYTRVSEKIVLNNLRAFQRRQLPIQVMQIDDGWQTAVGDWTNVNAKFPNGLAQLVEQIHQAGYQAGLWIAPFVCIQQSTIFKHHKNWLLHQKSGKLVTAGYNVLWKSEMYVLDFYQTEVREYLSLVLRTLLECWRFDWLKLDFLYAVALQPPAHKTKGEAMYEAMAWLRQQTQGRTILACGVPLGSAFGQADYCRIGADVHLEWEFGILHRLRNRERVSTHNALRSTVYNRHLNGLVFGNDPDVAILRHKKHHLLPEQQMTLWLMNQIFGNVQFISDNIDDYSTNTLQIYAAQFPLQNKFVDRVEVVGNTECYVIDFRIEQLTYRSYSNWSNEPQFFDLPNDRLYFNCLNHQFEAENKILLAPYQSILYLCSALQPKTGTVIGSCGALFAGSEVKKIETSGERMLLQLFEPLPYKTQVYLVADSVGSKKLINDRWISAENIQGISIWKYYS
ncbi:MAG: alpha-galactosidase [Chitinophagales bacterium]|nr:alpha-galactosidase [Chitinophagales bacterium]